jgi:hypothetical protein
MIYIYILLFIFVQIVTAQQSPHGKIKIACELCHSTDSWSMRKNTPFKHDSTGFILAGRHKNVQCRSCHQKLVFVKRGSDCLSCHTDIHRQELGQNCQRCHTLESWLISDMKQKHFETRFPLLGKHALATCDACHTQASIHKYAGTPLTCVACHKTNYETTSSPNHAAAGFNTNCSQCHNVSTLSWSGAFDHNLTALPLTGAHRAIACSQCHLNNKFSKLSSFCYDCHTSDFTRVQFPNHVTGNFNHDCLQCHTTVGWTPATFNHSTTKFALTGKHTSVQCQACHKSGNYQLSYTDCYQCHQTGFQNAINPNHVTGNFNHDCMQCHSTNGWTPATFNHSTTKFALTGKHTSVQCQACHKSGNYQLSYTDCYQCHQTGFQNATNPNHVTANFTHDCVQCHTTVGWTPATFNHSTTKFVLTGKHTSVLCQACHTNGNYQLSYTDCYQCHQTGYQNATNPNHVTANFTHDCVQCHTTVGWTPATFNHSTTKFVLTGKHTSVLCQACHTNGNYQLSYTDCYQCHQAGYEQVANPNHVTQLFEHDCMPCHSTSVWTPNTMNHDASYFRIYSGKHLNRWTQCSQCHTTPGILAAFSCTTGCHQSAHHQGENCYSCHKSG